MLIPDNILDLKNTNREDKLNRKTILSRLFFVYFTTRLYLVFILS